MILQSAGRPICRAQSTWNSKSWFQKYDEKAKL